MAFPRRCKKCRCYVADQLTKCPRCNTSAPTIVVLTKAQQRDEKVARNAKAEEKLPRIHQKNIRWKPSAFSLAAHRDLEQEIRRRIERADTPRMRNAFRSELRAVQAVLRRGTQSGPCWHREFQYDHDGAVSVYVSPKGRRYVLAERDETASLIIENRKNAIVPRTRLVRYEHSNVFGRIKLEEKIAKQAHTKAVEKVKTKKAQQKAIDAATIDSDTLS